MKYIIKNPTEEQIKSLKKLGLCVFYSESEGIHYVDVPEINDSDLSEGVVDLGLPSGLKWASCNIGANKPCEYGKLFQFGRTDGYYHTDSNYKFYVGDGIPTTTSGTVYKVGEVLNSKDDAACAATNGKLRMPTYEEIEELIYNTENTWCQCKDVLGDNHTSHTVWGRLFTGSNGNKIFIPAAGQFSGVGNSFDFIESKCILWSSSVYSSDANSAYNICFDEFFCDYDYNLHSIGGSVRGVCK